MEVRMQPDPREVEFIRLVREMLARPEYLLPLAAAEAQFRNHYYRLNAGALLEDLFSDALTNFVNLWHPERRFRRAPQGEREWDYEYEGLQVSHKVYLGGAVAVLWDATVDMTEWSAAHPILLVVGKPQPSMLDVEGPDGARGRLALLAGESVVPGRVVALGQWAGGSSELTILRADRVPDGALRPWDVVPFRGLWVALRQRAAEGVPLNELDLYATRRAQFAPDLGVWRIPCPPVRPGLYLLPQGAMQGLGVRRNNRAVILPVDTIKVLLQHSQDLGLFVPLSLWYQAYAEDRPPDLYSVQRQEFDALFGPQGFRRGMSRD